MTLRHCAVHEIVHERNVWDGNKYIGTEKAFSDAFTPSIDDTYIVVFSKDQTDRLTWLEENIGKLNGHIVYKSPLAVNYNYPTRGPWNTLVVFEFEPLPK